MAHIKSIRFEHVGSQEGCICDRRGQYIRNIWTVTYQEGETIHYGIDCFEKVKKSGGLNAYGKKLMNQIMKSIQFYDEKLAEYQSGNLTEENDASWHSHQAEWNDSYWKGKNYDEYKTWMIEEVFPSRIAEKEKELEKFKRINFEA